MSSDYYTVVAASGGGLAHGVFSGFTENEDPRAVIATFLAQSGPAVYWLGLFGLEATAHSSWVASTVLMFLTRFEYYT